MQNDFSVGLRRKLMPFSDKLRVDCFKIEGRTKSVYYLSVITRSYRMALDKVQAGEKVPTEVMNEIWAVANRDYITGFLEANPREQGENFEHSHSEHQTHLFCGIVDGFNNMNNRATIKVRNRFEIGDEMELMSPEGTVAFNLAAIYGSDGEPLAIAHGGGQDVEIELPEKKGEYRLLRKKLHSSKTIEGKHD